MIPCLRRIRAQLRPIPMLAFALGVSVAACRIDVTGLGGASPPSVQVTFAYADTLTPELELRVHLHPGRDADHRLRALSDEVVHFGALELHPASVDSVEGWRHYKASLSDDGLILPARLIVPLPDGERLSMRLDAYQRAESADTVAASGDEIHLPLHLPQPAWNGETSGSWHLEVNTDTGSPLLQLTSKGFPPDTVVLPVALLPVGVGWSFAVTTWISAYRSSVPLPSTADPQTKVGVSYESVLRWAARS